MPVAPEMFARLGLWWTRHRNPRFLFPGLGSGWKDKYGCKLMAMREARHPISESGVQQAMKAAVLTSRLKKTGILAPAPSPAQPRGFFLAGSESPGAALGHSPNLSRPGSPPLQPFSFWSHGDLAWSFSAPSRRKLGGLDPQGTNHFR